MAMERTTPVIDKTKRVQINTNDEPIVVSKYLMDLLLEQDNYLELCGLYMFYYYTAKWQRTNQVKATNSYVAKGIGCSEDRLKKYKAKLIELKLIENIIIKDEDESRIIGHYVKVNFLWTKESLHELTKPTNHKVKDKNTIRGNFHQMVFTPPNALNTNSKSTTIEKHNKNIIPPIFNDVEQYCKKRNSSVDPNQFFNWYTSKGWCIGKEKMKDWQAAIRTWEIKDGKTKQPSFKPSQFKAPFKEISGRRYWLNEDDGEYYQRGSGEKYVE